MTGVYILLSCPLVFLCGLLILNALAAGWGAPVGEILQKGPTVAMPFQYLGHLPVKDTEDEDLWYKSEVEKMTAADLLFVRQHINAKYGVRRRLVLSALEKLGVHEEQISKEEGKAKSSLATTTCAAFFLTAFINWFVFFAIACVLRGDGLNGKVENGRYYVAWHGQYNEVLPAFFWFSRIHVAYSIGIFVCGMICLALMGQGKRAGGFFTLQFRTWQRWVMFGVPGAWVAAFLLMWAFAGFRITP